MAAASGIAGAATTSTTTATTTTITSVEAKPGPKHGAGTWTRHFSEKARRHFYTWRMPKSKAAFVQWVPPPEGD